MHALEWFIGLLLGAMLLSALARRLGVPYPTFLALGGIVIAFLPNSPNWTLDPDLALALFVRSGCCSTPPSIPRRAICGTTGCR